MLSGYDTSPHGELLVSTFTAAMHKKEPMSGHILPVIFSWHLGIQLNDVAKSATGAFDPQGLWLAWERGSEITVDTFGPQWNFWAVVHEPVGTLRRRYGIPPLDPAVDATLALLEPWRAGSGVTEMSGVSVTTPISRHISSAPPPASRPFRRDEAGLSVRNHLSPRLERLSRHGTLRASPTGPQVSFY